MTNCADLPNDLLILILSKLFGKDRQRCRLVCKSWNDAILISPYHSFPCLTFYPKSTLWKFHQYNKFYTMEVPKIHSADILCSKYGWLLMSRDRWDLILFHPFSGKLIGLLSPDEYYTMFSFYNSPTSSDCIIVGIKDYVNDTRVGVGMFKLGDYELEEWENEWSHHEYTCKKPFMLSSCTPILHGELLYFLDIKGNVATFDIEKLSFKIHAKCLLPARLRGNLKQHFLIKLQEKEGTTILSVFVEYDEEKINVYRLLEPDMRWESVKDLGDNMLFVSTKGSFAKIAPTDSMKNCVYLTKFYGQISVYYSLETKRYHSIDGVYNSWICYGLAESFGAWIVPS